MPLFKPVHGLVIDLAKLGKPVLRIVIFRYRFLLHVFIVRATWGYRQAPRLLPAALPWRFACTPSDENGMPESRFRIKDIFLSSPTSFIGDPEFLVFPLHPVHCPQKQDWIPDLDPRLQTSRTSVGNDQFAVSLGMFIPTVSWSLARAMR